MGTEITGNDAIKISKWSAWKCNFLYYL